MYSSVRVHQYLSLPLTCYLCLLGTLFIRRLYPLFLLLHFLYFFFSFLLVFPFFLTLMLFVLCLSFISPLSSSSVPLPTSFSSPASSSSSFGPIEVEPNAGTPRRRPLSFCPCCAHEGNVTSHAPCSPWPQLGCRSSTSQLVTTRPPAFFLLCPQTNLLSSNLVTSFSEPVAGY